LPSWFVRSESVGECPEGARVTQCFSSAGPSSVPRAAFSVSPSAGPSASLRSSPSVVLSGSSSTNLSALVVGPRLALALGSRQVKAPASVRVLPSEGPSDSPSAILSALSSAKPGTGPRTMSSADPLQVMSLAPLPARLLALGSSLVPALLRYRDE
jgi:hypothetical protein